MKPLKHLLRLCTIQLSEADGECREGKAGQASGMVLPFEPMTMTFKDLHYYVPISKVLQITL